MTTQVPANDSLTPLQALSAHIVAARAGDVVSHEIMKDELFVTIKRECIVPFLTFLRDDTATQCQQLVDLCGVDNPGNPDRFCVVYNLLSLSHNHRVRVKLHVPEGAAVDTVTGVYPAAGWFEREAYDLFGIPFADHPDLRRILTDYGFSGHPLRKDFPMTGFVELRYDAEQRRVVYGPVELTQDFRNFDFTSPWEGMTDMQVPGDKKDMKPSRGWAPVKVNVGEVK